ncbi:MAG: CHAT domain-containing protein [Hyphomicrobiaceae bacterium]
MASPRCGLIINPDRCPDEPMAKPELAKTKVFARVVSALKSAAGYFRDRQADDATLRELCPLLDTAHELRWIAKSLDAGEDSIVLGAKVTEPAIRHAKLDRYRVLHFATNGLLAGEMAEFAKGKAEPALVFTPPSVASDEDDGLLTASEITELKLDADWVVMSACNTAAGDAKGAEALSGLAKAFFYAGARALLVSHWPVNSYAATMLTSTTFSELKRDPKLNRAEAFRRSMVSLMRDKDRPWAAHPSVWAPFVVVGEGGIAMAR